MKAMKRLTAMLLALVLFVGLLPATIPKANAAISTSTFETKVQDFISDSRWKNGIAWGDSQTPKLSKWSSTGCCAYAADFAAYVYGSTSAAWTSSDFTKFTDLNEIRAGDIIHTSNHWFVVLERNGDTFRTAEGNFDDKTRVCSDGWGIKNGKIYNLKATDGERTFEYGYHYNFSDGSSTPTYSSSQIYHNIDMSAAVLASRTNQQVSGDCAVVSMATVEAYMYGATSAADKKTVYNALVSKNRDNDYAYWSNCGYVSHSSINWTTVYNNLSKGYPVIVHRPATSSKVQHWAVVAGYKGSTTTLEKDKFIIVDVYHGSGGTDIYTSGSWRGSATIDQMVTRKNGIAITSLSGIKMAINHPAAVHQYGEGHGVYGYVASNANLTSVQVKVTNASGTAVYNKTLTPNAKSYLIYNLDSEMTFAKWAKGKYTYTVTAKTASSSRTYQYAFEIASGWPVDQTLQSYVFAFNANGGTGAPANQTVYFDGTLHIPAATPTREGYTFLGWYAQRNGDQTWYSAGNGWHTDAQLTASGYTKRLYPTDTDFIINNSWLSGCMDTTGFTFYAVWEKNAVSTYTVSYNANGGSGAPASQTKTHDVSLTLSSTTPTRSGYTFLGWATSATGSVAYQPGSSLTANADTTLYAVWEEIIIPEGALVSVQNVTAAPGGTVVVTVALSGNSGMSYLAVTPVYDSSVLTLVSAENGQIMKDFDCDTNFTWSASEDTAANGTLLSLTFKIADNAQSGEYAIELKLREAYTLMGEDVAVSIQNGSVRVSDMVYGDATGDGIVNGKDVLLLRRYMANYNYDTNTSEIAVGAGGDANGDGIINGKDVLLMRRYMANYNYDTGTSTIILGPQ